MRQQQHWMCGSNLHLPQTHRLGDVLSSTDLAQLDITWVLAKGFTNVKKQLKAILSVPKLSPYSLNFFYLLGSTSQPPCPYGGRSYKTIAARKAFLDWRKGYTFDLCALPST